ncbi:hypothetical protein, partial [Burkholderia territorii]|uniref:hypothetical protein n=1 Tax=Burkholderia territorii TaxID=1503055 RepID=UPI001E6509E7
LLRAIPPRERVPGLRAARRIQFTHAGAPPGLSQVLFSACHITCATSDADKGKGRRSAPPMALARFRRRANAAPSGGNGSAHIRTFSSRKYRSAFSRIK